METRPQVSTDLLVSAVTSGTHRIIVAMIHPDDHKQLSEGRLTYIQSLLRLNAVLPSSKVERGFLFVETQQVRR